jgi:hypothetical protein
MKQTDIDQLARLTAKSNRTPEEQAVVDALNAVKTTEGTAGNTASPELGEANRKLVEAQSKIR